MQLLVESPKPGTRDRTPGALNPIPVFLESGAKRAFAGAVDWPGWCRGGCDEQAALQALCDYGPRYAGALQAAQIEFLPPVDPAAFAVIEQQPGNATTDFGAPDAALASDALPFDEAALRCCLAVLDACWLAFDRTVQGTAGRELRRGPRGGGRDLDRLAQHVLDAHTSYLARLAWKHQRIATASLGNEIARSRQATADALAAAGRGEMPAHGPRGGVLWTPRYFARRAAWHLLDHAWEIEDRVV